MNSYEHTIIARQDLSENQVKKLLDKYKNIINGNSGKILKTESWGLRNLSYEIKSNKKGLYFHIKLIKNVMNLVRKYTVYLVFINKNQKSLKIP